MAKTGTGIFFDGVTSARQDVALELAPTALIIRSQAGEELGAWPYVKLKHQSAPDHVFRIACARIRCWPALEIYDADFAHEVDLLAPLIDRTGAAARRAQLQAIVLGDCGDGGSGARRDFRRSRHCRTARPGGAATYRAAAGDDCRRPGARHARQGSQGPAIRMRRGAGGTRRARGVRKADGAAVGGRAAAR